MLPAGGWCNLLAASCPSLAVHACARAPAAAAVMQQAGRPHVKFGKELSPERRRTDGAKSRVAQVLLRMDGKTKQTKN